MVKNEKKNDAKKNGIFQQGDFSQDAIYTSGSVLKTISVQFFEEPLDKLGTLYQHAWCKFSDIPNVQDNGKLEINGVVYGIMDFTADEFNQAVDLFLQKVQVMNNLCNLTEGEVSTQLISDAKAEGITAPRVVVVSREAKSNGITRTVRFALVVPANNEPLIDKLIANALDRDQNYYFVGSEVNLQNDAMEIDYLYFEAKIMGKRP